MPEIPFVAPPSIVVEARLLRELVGRLVDSVTMYRYLQTLTSPGIEQLRAGTMATLDAETQMLAIVLDNAIDPQTLRQAAVNAYDEGELTRSYQISRIVQFIVTQLAGQPQPLVEEFEFVKAPTASRCATDLRNRGFKVAGDLTGRTILVETPAGWTGTPARDVVHAHEPTAVPA